MCNDFLSDMDLGSGSTEGSGEEESISVIPPIRSETAEYIGSKDSCHNVNI